MIKYLQKKDVKEWHFDLPGHIAYQLNKNLPPIQAIWYL